ncbi:MAG TPA: alpha/beta hydrolase [Mycobacterium sp.]|nr:alpha/beta hydrolase [Acidimicrobiia bacterium]HWS93426.1 alpha/beta hydrolase [Mycobacterium sp.]
MTVRKRSPRLRLIEVPTATIAVWEWDGDDPPLLLVHAAGLHGRCWDQVIGRLPANRRVVAVDCRGHGRSSVPAPPYPWSHLAADLAEVIDQMELDRIVGVGHSMGGHLVARAAAARPAQFDRLVLLDPAIVSPELLDLIAAAQDRIPPIRRRSRWASPEEMAKHLAKRDAFRQWDRTALADYCHYGLRPATDGNGFDLACPPSVEHAIYLGQAEPDIYERVRSIELPVRIVRCRERPIGATMTDFSYSPTWPNLVRVFPNATEQHLRGARHFFPMEDPKLGAAVIDTASA